MSSGNGKDLPDAELLAATMRIAAESAAHRDRQASEPEEDEPAPRRRRLLAIHVALYLATIVTTWLAGGPLFALTLMTILSVHEAGHYLFAMRHRVAASLPFFVPFPYSAFGTMGAVIAMPARIPSRRALLDIGAAGPIAGFLVAVPALALGMHWSTIASVPSVPGEWVFGDNLLVKLLGGLFGPANPHDDVVVLHPVGFAGYVGSLVTAFNLIPVGQLDGGHVLHALVGRRRVERVLGWARRLRVRIGELSADPDTLPVERAAAAVGRAILARAARLATFAGLGVPRLVGTVIVAVLLVLGVTTPWKGWLLWAALLVMLGVDHPPTTEETEGLDPPRAGIALACLLILILTFVPVPVHPLP